MNQVKETQPQKRDERDATYWAWVGPRLVNCHEDGSIPLNARVLLEVTSDTIESATHISARIAQVPRIERVLQKTVFYLESLERERFADPKKEARELAAELRELLI